MPVERPENMICVWDLYWKAFHAGCLRRHGNIGPFDSPVNECLSSTAHLVEVLCYYNAFLSHNTIRLERVLAELHHYGVPQLSGEDRVYVDVHNKLIALLWACTMQPRRYIGKDCDELKAMIDANYKNWPNLSAVLTEALYRLETAFWVST